MHRFSATKMLLEHAGDLPVHHHRRAFVRPRHDQFVKAVGRIDQRPIGQRVRADRENDERLQILSHDRSARRKAVRRAADRRADDQAVATIGGGQFRVNVKIDGQQRKGRPGKHRHFVAVPCVAEVVVI